MSKMKEEEIIREIMKKRNMRKVLESLTTLNFPSRYEISKLLKIDYREVHRSMKSLERWGLVEGEEKRSEKGVLRFRKVYKLTNLGEKILKSMLEDEIQSIALIYASVGLSNELRRELDKLRTRNRNGEVPSKS
jgi:predicted ArsR family transcriptional regulator